MSICACLSRIRTASVDSSTKMFPSRAIPGSSNNLSNSWNNFLAMQSQPPPPMPNFSNQLSHTIKSHFPSMHQNQIKVHPPMQCLTQTPYSKRPNSSNTKTFFQPSQNCNNKATDKDENMNTAQGLSIIKRGLNVKGYNNKGLAECFEKVSLEVLTLRISGGQLPPQQKLCLRGNSKFKRTIV